jgi:hypothetical protein
MHSTIYAERRTHPSRGNHTSALAGSVISQTTGVEEVIPEVHTSVASVEAPGNTRQNRRIVCVSNVQPQEILKVYIITCIFNANLQLIVQYKEVNKKKKKMW